MNRGIYTIASGGVAAQMRLDTIAQNLSNVGTAGYKAERVAFDVSPLQNFPVPVYDSVLAETQPLVVGADMRRDFTQGSVNTTGNPLDVAITGAGFFAVTTPRGERYTRNGTFTIDKDGFLSTPEGFHVQGEQGAEIRLSTTGGPIEISEDGSIRSDGNTVGRLKLVDFGPQPSLVPEGDSLYAPVPGTGGAPLPPEQVAVQQYAIERANVDVVQGMVALVDVSRTFETYMRAITRLDELQQRSINEVGRTA
jgi:flagellar basal-body rod protein FlgG